MPCWHGAVLRCLQLRPGGWGHWTFSITYKTFANTCLAPPERVLDAVMRRCVKDPAPLLRFGHLRGACSRAPFRTVFSHPFSPSSLSHHHQSLWCLTRPFAPVASSLHGRLATGRRGPAEPLQPLPLICLAPPACTLPSLLRLYGSVGKPEAGKGLACPALVVLCISCMMWRCCCSGMAEASTLVTKLQQPEVSLHSRSTHILSSTLSAMSPRLVEQGHPTRQERRACLTDVEITFSIVR